MTTDPAPHPGWLVPVRRSTARWPANVIPPALGPLIARLRTSRDLSQSELARRIGVGPHNISRIEGGTRCGSVGLFAEMAGVLALTEAERIDLVEAMGFRIRIEEVRSA